MDPKMLDIVDRFESAINSRDDRVHRANASGMRPAIVSEIDQEGVAWVTVQGSSDAIPIEQVTNRLHPGDRVLISINDGVGSETGNISCPATDDTVAKQALADAAIAQEAASNATRSAEQAESAAESAQASADSASENARKSLSYLLETEDSWTAVNNYRTQAQRTMIDIGAAADSAQADAGIAHTAASQATFGLSEVEKVVGTLNWISEHATYSLTQDQAVVDGKLYYTRSGSGTTQDPYVYTPVIDPQASGLSSYYEMALDKSVQNYIASHLAQTNYGLDIMVDGSLFKIHLGTVDGTQVMGTYIIDAGGNIVGKFDANGFQFGKTGESHLIGDYHSLQLIDSGERRYLHISDLRDSQGYAVIQEWFDVGDKVAPAELSYYLAYEASSLTSVYVGNDDVTAFSSTRPRVYMGRAVSQLVIDPPDYSGTIVAVTYTTESPDAKGFTFGYRESLTVIGGLSAAFGYDVEASGVASFAENIKTVASGIGSHAEGWGTVASREYSHAEGYSTVASGSESHAEGNNTRATYSNAHSEGTLTKADAPSSHVEGIGSQTTAIGAHAEGRNTLASGWYAHAEGFGSEATAQAAHAQGEKTKASSTNQAVFGRYNIEDTSNEYAVIVGNGSDSGRSNAYTLDWSGNAVHSGNVSADNAYLDIDTSAASGTDYDLYSALTTLGWTSDVIVS